MPAAEGCCTHAAVEGSAGSRRSGAVEALGCIVALAMAHTHMLAVVTCEDVMSVRAQLDCEQKYRHETDVRILWLRRWILAVLRIMLLWWRRAITLVI